MGWYYTETTKKQLIESRIKPWENIRGDLKVNSQCIAHCYRGNRFSGVLYMVLEHTRTNIVTGEVKMTDRWIEVDLLRYHSGMWGYKDMEESMHPYYYSCPLSYLAMVPNVTSEEWRAGVQKYHARSLEKRRINRQFKLALA
jgi:hypothetical protein